MEFEAWGLKEAIIWLGDLGLSRVLVCSRQQSHCC